VLWLCHGTSIPQSRLAPPLPGNANVLRTAHQI
jgi:hypothetical protein